ncbi:MAG: polysaccharide biosynthesis/export family protein [Sedimentisphaerales bacterium]|nr:polysaccharide biosynthesis/export family protein [Sedimentisphaerales bacterium]
MVTKLKKRVSYFRFALCVLLLAILTGCGNKFFDPTQVGRFRTVPAVNVILDSLGVAEETPVAWEEGEEPRPIDTVPDEVDYTFRAGDIIRVDIYELFGLGTRMFNDFPVSETGKISIPEVGVVEVVNLTETQLEEKIKQILSPTILKNPLVTVTLMSSQQRVFSILGDGVLAPNRYVIPRYNFRLTDAIAMASGTRQFNVSYIYVSRPLKDDGKTQPISKSGLGGRAQKATENIIPTPAQQTNPSWTHNQSQWPKSRVVISSSELITDRESAAIRKRYQLLQNSNWNTTNRQNIWQMSEMSDTTSINEPTSVQEVLKTLAERSGGETGTTGQVNSANGSRSYEPRTLPGVQTNNSMNQQGVYGQSAGTVTVSGPGNSSSDASSGHIEWVYKNGKWVPTQVGDVGPVETRKENGNMEWVFRNGKWVLVQTGRAKPTEPITQRQPGEQFITPPEQVAAPDFGWTEQGTRTRLIKIPTEKLITDPRYNIVIKPGDTIFVPVDLVGEFYIMGNVNNTGPIPITGRPMTLKQAIAAAGGLGPLAWPKRCEVIRRIGRKKEEIVMVDLDKIFSGEQPDFFIKPHDTINVGTHATARWRAILRNAFRATYGFGFVYDRNFADIDFVGAEPVTRQVLNWF